MKKTFSTLEYRNSEWQIVIVGVDTEEKDRIKRYLKKIIRANESGEHFKLMIADKEWEE